MCLKSLLSVFKGGYQAEPAKPAIQPCGTIDINTASSILLDKLEEIGQGAAEIYLPDTDIKIYNKDEVVNSYELREVSLIPYIPEKFDCDDFAAELYGKFAGLVWSDVHALNWFISEDNKFYFIEPQTRRLSPILDTWQGYKIRFFLGR
uniref:Agglutinin C-terminal domain-containing protein n=1 Tax=viral metagenome TaxID=1070528 RepID=A0A6M3JPB7_9ZZZZ